MDGSRARVEAGRMAVRTGLLLALASVLFLAACEKPDASFTTSPSAQTLLGTTTGNVSFNPAEVPPGEHAPPTGWHFDVGNARFSQLEQGDASIQLVMLMSAKPGPAFELWFERDGQPVVRWSGGSAHAYNGSVCFQLQLKDKAKGEALTLGPGSYSIVLAFRDPGTGEIVAAKRIPVVGTIPKLKGTDLPSGTRVFRDLLGCPRSVV
jgi:hypothetical protein